MSINYNHWIMKWYYLLRYHKISKKDNIGCKTVRQRPSRIILRNQFKFKLICIAVTYSMKRYIRFLLYSTAVTYFSTF